MLTLHPSGNHHADPMHIPGYSAQVSGSTHPSSNSLETLAQPDAPSIGLLPGFMTQVLTDDYDIENDIAADNAAGGDEGDVARENGEDAAD